MAYGVLMELTNSALRIGMALMLAGILLFSYDIGDDASNLLMAVTGAVILVFLQVAYILSCMAYTQKQSDSALSARLMRLRPILIIDLILSIVCLSVFTLFAYVRVVDSDLSRTLKSDESEPFMLILVAMGVLSLTWVVVYSYVQPFRFFRAVKRGALPSTKDQQSGDLQS